MIYLNNGLRSNVKRCKGYLTCGGKAHPPHTGFSVHPFGLQLRQLTRCPQEQNNGHVWLVSTRAHVGSAILKQDGCAKASHPKSSDSWTFEVRFPFVLWFSTHFPRSPLSLLWQRVWWNIYSWGIHHSFNLYFFSVFLLFFLNHNTIYGNLP